MKLSLTMSGLLDPGRLDSWMPAKRLAIRRAVESAFKTAGKEMVQVVRTRMQQVFKVKKAAFLKSMRHKVYAGTPYKFPALLIGSKIKWLGLQMRGGSIQAKMLIPLLPEHQRIGRKAFARVVDGLMRSGNAFFIKKNDQVILMAENIKENATQLRRFKRAERARSGAKSIKRGQEVPIAVLVSRVTLRGRLDLSALVRANLHKVAQATLQQLNAKGL